MTYVMSDIHGDLDRFRSVMDQIHLKADDHLYVLGDVIDGYPYGLDILYELRDMPNATIQSDDSEYCALISAVICCFRRILLQIFAPQIILYAVCFPDSTILCPVVHHRFTAENKTA